eukprot:3934735-Rhodomonas_salina.1
MLLRIRYQVPGSTMTHALMVQVRCQMSGTDRAGGTGMPQSPKSNIRGRNVYQECGVFDFIFAVYRPTRSRGQLVPGMRFLVFAFALHQSTRKSTSFSAQFVPGVVQFPVFDFRRRFLVFDFGLYSAARGGEESDMQERRMLGGSTE